MVNDRITAEETAERVKRIARAVQELLQSRAGTLELTRILGDDVEDFITVTYDDDGLQSGGTMPSVTIDGTGDQNVYVIMIAAS